MAWETKRLDLRVLDEKDAKDVFLYRLRNRSHLLPWEPLRPERSVEE
ncbi:MAG: hypothetical protein GY822_32385 [Deltaproteobacteria bacterium]|nr:hypothetical protein [Deltaproteobacteria bacterium]